MGIFSKNKVEKKGNVPKIPSLPELPSLPSSPDFPSMGDYENKNEIHQLPSFPSSATGEMFSKNTIKSAVKGESEMKFYTEEEGEEFEFNPIKNPIQPRKIENKPIPRVDSSQAPVFVRIDKFQEGLELFEETKRGLNEIESLLKDIKRVKDEEVQELNSWEKELEKIKNQIDKINRDVFSKV